MKALWRWLCGECNRQFWTNSANDGPRLCPFCGGAMLISNYRGELFDG